MTYAEAKTACTPFITLRNAEAYLAETDGMLWVEENIMDTAGIHSSICTAFGERICEWIEIELCALHDAHVNA